MRLGGYELEHEIGRGGAGVVYSGRAADGKRVAVKVLISREPAILERFEREARIQASLGASAGFVPILDARVVEGRAFLVMPFVEGGSLRARLERGPLPSAVVQELGRTLALALGEAHERGIVHRDLKPENVLFTGEGQPLIADLGLAKHFDGTTGALSLSKSGALVGTAGYMAPEQIENARMAGPPADVFSLGAVLYEALAGTPPFEGSSVLEVLACVTSGEHEPLGNRCPDAPRGLVVAIERALSRDARERPQHGRAFAGALGGATARPGRARWPLALAALLLLAAGSAAGFLAGRAGPPPPPPRPPVPPTVPGPTTGGRTRFPPECAGFLATRRTKLTGLGGSYAWHHRDAVEHVAISAGGDLVVTVTHGRKLRGWRAPEGTELWSREVPYPLDGLAVSWDARRVLGISGERGVLEVRDARTGEIEWTLEEPWLRGVRRVSFTQDTRFQIASATELLGFGDAETHTMQHASEMPGPRVVAVATSPDGKRVALEDAAGAIEIRAADGSGVLARANDPATPRCERMAYSGDGSSLAIWSSGAGEIVVYDPATAAVKERIATGQPIAELSLRDAGTAFVVDGRGALARWDLAAKARGEELVGPGTPVFAATNDGRLAVMARERTLALVDLEAGAAARVESVETALSLGVLARRRAVLGGESGSLHVVALDAGATRVDIAIGRGAIGPLAVTGDGNRVVFGTRGGVVAEEDVERSVTREIGRLGASVSAIAVTAQGTKVVAGGQDGEIAVWDLANGTRTGPDRTYGDEPIDGLSWLSDGSGFVVTTETGKIAVGASSLVPFTRKRPSGTDVTCSPAGRRALVVAAEGVALLWDLEKNAEIGPVPCPNELTGGVWLDASHVALGGRDGTIRIIAVDGREEIDRIDLSGSDDLPAALAARDGELYVLTARCVVLRFSVQLGP